jgi:hypothetical protein
VCVWAVRDSESGVSVYKAHIRSHVQTSIIPSVFYTLCITWTVKCSHLCTTSEQFTPRFYQKRSSKNMPQSTHGLEQAIKGI